MKGLKTNLEKATLENKDYRKVLYTSKHSQLVLMCLQPGQDIGSEVHAESDQFFRVESGSGTFFIDGNEYSISDGDALIIPSGARHNIINTDPTKEMKLYTIYSPAHHLDGIVRHTKKEAEENEAEFDGKTTE